MSTTLEKYPAESLVFSLRCAARLADGETITGTPVMSQLPELSGGDALTFGTPTVNASPIAFDDGTDAAGTVIQVRISGGSVPAGESSRLYAVMAAAQTSASNTMLARGVLAVQNPDIT